MINWTNTHFPLIVRQVFDAQLLSRLMPASDAYAYACVSKPWESDFDEKPEWPSYPRRQAANINHN